MIGNLTNDSDSFPSGKSTIKRFFTSRLYESIGFRKIWKKWVAYRESIGHPITSRALSRMVHLLNRMQVEDAIKTIQRSIDKHWIGLFDIPGKKHYSKRLKVKNKKKGNFYNELSKAEKRWDDPYSRD